MGYCVDEMTTQVRDRLLVNVQPHADIVVASQTRAAVIDAVAMHLRYIADNFVEPQIRQVLQEEGRELLHGNTTVLSHIRSTLSTAAGVILTRLAVHGVCLMLGGGDGGALAAIQFVTNSNEQGQSCHDDLVKALSGVHIAGRGTESTAMRFWQR